MAMRKADLSVKLTVLSMELNPAVLSGMKLDIWKVGELAMRLASQMG
jgi:hypothetical protein